ncbi:MAG: tetratricopeptide repeat protein [Cyclobacteriaceae bacterium]|nr:tetratricopeptide repeat protein [Cyclobacteriaceae bacterium]
MLFKERAYYLIVGFLCLIVYTTAAQDQRIADSLAVIYKNGQLEGTERLELLRNLSFNELHDPALSLKYAEELITLAQAENNDLYLYRGYIQKGNNHKLTGDLEVALEAFFKSVEAAKAATYTTGEGTAYMSIADTYSIMGNADNAESYYQRAIEMLRITNDSISLASALLNAGDAYFNSKKYEAALQNFEESGRIFKEVNYLIGTAYNLGNVGMVYAEQGKDALAEQNINEAISILEELEDYYPISVYLTYMSDIYLRKEDLNTALSYAERSLELATTYGLKDQIGDANLKLSELHEQAGNSQTAYEHYKGHILFRDSVQNIETIQQMADLRTDFEVSQKQIEVDLLNQQKRNQRIIVIATVIALFLIGLLALGLFRRNKYIQKTNRIIEQERNRSENLLRNILPEETALELKMNGKVQAKKFDSVSVLFTDFKGFTRYAENLAPEKLVESVDYYFSRFDEIMEKYQLEKIKTVGDAYMCAGGLPYPSEDHALKIVSAAVEIATFVNDSKKLISKDQTRFDIRIGINTGPVVAGVVGTKKFAYDIWGDTVNIASRMEANSEPGRINISEQTYGLIKGHFDCEYRGEIKVKNRGKMKMYFVKPDTTSMPVPSDREKQVLH